MWTGADTKKKKIRYETHCLMSISPLFAIFDDIKLAAEGMLTDTFLNLPSIFQ